MATYFFETITAAQALSFNTASDALVFSNATSSGSKTAVTYNAATATSTATVTITDLVTGHAVTFGTGIYGEGETGNNAPVFADASTLVVGSPLAADTMAIAATGPSGLFGGDGADSLTGGVAGDVLQGNQGDDTLIGGAGSDTIFGGKNDDLINVGTGNNFAQGRRRE